MKPIKDKLYWLYPEGTVPNSIIDYALEQLKDKERNRLLQLPQTHK